MKHKFGPARHPA